MKKLFLKYLHISDDEKLTEETYLTRTVLSVIAIAVCVIALCSATYAYFSDSIVAPCATATAATYTVTVSTSAAETPADADHPYEYVCPAAANDRHTFTLSAENSTAETGYCKIKITDKDGNVSSYCTTQIFRTDGGVGRTTSVTLTIVAAEGCRIEILPHWGTSAGYATGTEPIYRDNDMIEHSTTPPAAGAAVAEGAASDPSTAGSTETPDADKTDGNQTN